MYSLLIADDEEIERKAFRIMVNRNFKNIIVLEDAIDGIDFIDKVEQFQPDIVIVDINMPGLNGLDAVKVLRQKGFDSKIIIHTAYSEFEFAQTALELGADEYILKPAKKEKIISTLANCISKIDDGQEKEKEHKKLEKMIQDITPIIETDFMSSVLLGDINRENSQIYFDILGINVVAGYIMTISLPREEIAIISESEVEKNALKKEILNFIKSEVENICNCIVSPIVSNKISLFISIDEEMSQYRFKVWSIDIAELLSGRVEKVFNIGISVGIGQLCTEFTQLSKSYKDSLRALTDISLNSNVKHFDDLFIKVKSYNSFKVHENEIIKHISIFDLIGCKKLIDRIFDDMDIIETVETIKDMVLEFVVVLNRALAENNVLANDGVGSLKIVFNEIMNLESKIELKFWLEKTIESIIELLNHERKVKTNSFVKSAIEYINENYTQDISLDIIAEKIGVSPYYLSRLFKQELNKNYIDYLTDIRIKHVFKLLKEKDYSIKELSEKVGYNNPTYFCKVFKKATGKTIGEYKNVK